MDTRSFVRFGFGSAALALAGSALAGSALAGCTGELGGSTPEEVPGPPDVTPLDVPASPEILESSASCAPLRDGEALLSVSPEGHAWLVVPGSTTSVRVLDPFGAEMMEVVEEIELTEVSAAQAWSGSDAALIASGGLWRLEDLARIELSPPEGFATPATLCGDPSHDGTLVSGGKVFERHEDPTTLEAQWWVWDPGFSGDEAPADVIRFDGECQSEDEVLWLTSADGTLFRVEPAHFSRPVRFAQMVSAAATGGMLAVLESDRLWVGPEAWQSWLFPGPTPASLSASAGHLWMVSGDQLLRFDGETFVEVTHAMEEPVLQVVAHAGGVWLVGATTACHQALEPLLRVEGVRPYLQSAALDHAISVRASDETATVAATLDGEEITLTANPETGWLEGTARLDEVGWHELVLVASGAAEVERTLSIKRLPEVERSWEADVSPIYQASCAGSTCHRAGSTDPPDLGSHAAWVEHADAIRAQVVQSKNMPPAANTGPDWGEGQIEIISQWLEGGMLP